MRLVGVQGVVLAAAGLLLAAAIPSAAAQGAGQGTPPGDCCSPEAMKKVAASLGFIDIVGIKLGMTPQQAFTAVKAFNPNLKIDIVNGRLEPGDAPGTFKRVPQFAVAHTVGRQANPLSPVPYTLADGSSDAIMMEFTIPPSPPLVGQIVRTVTFPEGQPVVASTLLGALEKKYGQEIVAEAYTRAWVFDASGKLLTRRLTQPEHSCFSGTGFDAFGYGSGIPGPAAPGAAVSDSPSPIDLSSTGANLSREKGLTCSALTFAMEYGIGEGTLPDTQMPSITVAIDSPALLYASRQSTRDWLQAQREAKARRQDDAAEQRSAPKL